MHFACDENGHFCIFCVSDFLYSVSLPSFNITRICLGYASVAYPQCLGETLKFNKTEMLFTLKQNDCFYNDVIIVRYCTKVTYCV